MIAMVVSVVVSCLVQALALQFAVNVVHSPAAGKNPYELALKVSAGMTLLGLAFGLVPFFGWLLMLVAWMVALTQVYRVGFIKGAGIGLLQALVHKLIMVVLGWMGLAWAAMV